MRISDWSSDVCSSDLARDEAEDHVIADRDAGDARPDLDDLAGAFVAADAGELLEPAQRGDPGVEDHIAGEPMLVGVAAPGCGPLDLYLTRLRIFELDVLDAPPGLGFPQDCCACLPVADPRRFALRST